MEINNHFCILTTLSARCREFYKTESWVGSVE